MLLSLKLGLNILTCALFILHISLTDCEKKEVTKEMKDDLKAWCIIKKGTEMNSATKKCCTKELGTCFKPDDYVKLGYTYYCLLKSNSKENSEAVKQCCTTRKVKGEKVTGKDGKKVGFEADTYSNCQ